LHVILKKNPSFGKDKRYKQEDKAGAPGPLSYNVSNELALLKQTAPSFA